MLLCIGHSTPHVTTVAHKGPQFSSYSAGDRLHLNAYTLDPTKSEWADYAAVQA